MIYIKFILIVVGLSLSNIIASDYDIGDIVNQNDQEQRFTICMVISLIMILNYHI